MTEYYSQLKKGGKLVMLVWENEDFCEKEIDPEQISLYLDNSICFQNGVILGDIFALLKSNVELFSYVSMYPNLKDLIEEATVKNDKTNDTIEMLELQWNVFTIGENNDSRLYKIIELYGITAENEKLNIETFCINELTKYKIFLNESFNVVKEEDSSLLLSTHASFTLREVINTIIMEMSLTSVGNDIIDDEADIEYCKKLLDNFDFKYATKPCKICGNESRSLEFGKPKDICSQCFRNRKIN